jgi:Arc/MetJ-type ribon-helix-helix transcriptional regulator
MKRRRPPTATELEAARRAAEEARVRAGLEAVPPDELEFERLQAERRARRQKGMR